MPDSSIARVSRREFVALAAAGAAGLAHAPRCASAPSPKRGGVLKVIGIEPPTFDIHGSVSYQTQMISSFVHRSLFTFVNGARYTPSDFTQVPDLALKAEPSADGKMYTIRLRPGVRWESRPPLNGREFVAADVKYTMQRALKKSGYANMLGRLEGIETPDKLTVRVHLADAFVPFLHNLAEPWNASA